MTDDVDESGWQYALKFHGADWHGKADSFLLFYSDSHLPF